MKSMSKSIAGSILIIGTMVAIAFAADKKDVKTGKPDAGAKSSVQKIIFEEQKIEGKIRRPQLVLIKADQRPNFSPMIMQSFGKTENIAEFVDQSVIDDAPNQGPFQFENNSIVNYIP
jgi:hypothetical protein